MPNITVTSQMANKTETEVIIKCAKCGNVMNVNDKFCTNCGEAFSGNNAIVSEEVVEVVDPSKFDIIFQAKDDDKLLEAFIYRELKKAELNLDTTLIPQELMKKKKISLILYFSVLIFVYISLIFFSLSTYNIYYRYSNIIYIIKIN
ncbi:MAG: zinc ribbon domain-containing protein [Clostridium sp.]|nr:MAG: zinc ribbon domain-containing protein [Clostridium sp.]